jgi:hypothetical protein
MHLLLKTASMASVLFPVSLSAYAQSTVDPVQWNVATAFRRQHPSRSRDKPSPRGPDQGWLARLRYRPGPGRAHPIESLRAGEHNRAGYRQDHILTTHQGPRHQLRPRHPGLCQKPLPDHPCPCKQGRTGRSSHGPCKRPLPELQRPYLPAAEDGSPHRSDW